MSPDQIIVSTIPFGLTAAEAARRMAEYGPNAIAENPPHFLRRILRHFWSPVPWMLEGTIALQLVIGEQIEALLITTLLLLNVTLGVRQETRANATLRLLKQQLAPRVRVRRDSLWIDASAADVVPGDIVQLSLGGIVPADMRLISGDVLLDQSMLTGESVPIDAGPDATAYAGALIRRGEAIGEVTATGSRTFFGRTAELVRTAHVESSEQKAVIGVVKAVTVVNFSIIALMSAYAIALGWTITQIIPLVLTALLSAVPASLPATFTLAATLGARRLASNGVLLARLPALQESAMIDVLCADKTGTLTENALALSGVFPIATGYTDGDVLALAAVASSADGQDPVDAAIRAAAAGHRGTLHAGLSLVRFVPFDPAAKLAEAALIDASGQPIRVIKGAPAAVAQLAPMTAAADAALDRFNTAGYRTLAVAAGSADAMRLVGLIALSDPPRQDSAGLLTELKSLGVRTVMLTGDAPATAATIAREIGLNGAVCPQGHIPDSAGPADFAVYAGIFPEGKFRLVKAFQQRGHAVGTCGDGANDAPALSQAQMGIAVSTATDIAKSAAGIVLTEPGLAGIVSCIKEGRTSFQRVLTYTMSILINKCATLIVMGGGLIMTGEPVLTPLLQALSMLVGDLITMARAGDRARFTLYPNRWRVRNMTLAAIPLGGTKLVYSMIILAIGWFVIGLHADQMRTLTFVTLLLAAQSNTYVMRERGHFWNSRPARVMLLASAVGLSIVAGFAVLGVLMAPLPVAIVAGLFVTTVGFAFVLDALKVAVFRRLQID